MTRKEIIEAVTKNVLDICYMVDGLDDVKFHDLASTFDKLGVLANRAHDLLAKIEQEAEE